MFYIDGKEMLPPDAGLDMSFEDLDGAASGRDAAGYMHRKMLRQKVGKWSFSYSRLTPEQYKYMEGLFAGKATFDFTYPDPENNAQSKTLRAYRTVQGITWENVRTGELRNYKFSVVEC